MNRLKITYNVQAPERRGFAKSEEVKAIEDFLTSGNAKNMCFEYDTKEEAKNKLATISGHKRKYNEQHPKGYDAYRVDKCIYIIRRVKRYVSPFGNWGMKPILAIHKSVLVGTRNGTSKEMFFLLSMVISRLLRWTVIFTPLLEHGIC